MDALTAAKSYAYLYHIERNKQMYGVLPYTHHLAAVEAVLREFSIFDEDLLVAAWLHDIVEDTEAKLRDVMENFGEDVGALVGAVTNEPGENRKVKAALTYPKIREVGPKAVALKLADRIANCRTGGGSLKMYMKEYQEFKRALYDETNFSWDPHDRHDYRIGYMWRELDQLMQPKEK